MPSAKTLGPLAFCVALIVAGVAVSWAKGSNAFSSIAIEVGVVAFVVLAVAELYRRRRQRHIA